MKTIAQQLNIQNFPFQIRDKRGNRIYSETSDGLWYKCEFDSVGNQTYFEDSDGYWWKREFDSNGNWTYFENSYGSWWKCEYNSNGKETYYENSKGTKRGHPSTIIIDGITYKKAK